VKKFLFSKLFLGRNEIKSVKATTPLSRRGARGAQT
jgi:hypothetical protein